MSPSDTPRDLVGRYRWNVALSMSLYAPRGYLEVAFRNDASEAGGRKGRRRALSREDIGAIVEAFQDFEGGGRHARAVHLDEIARSNWNLNIERYVEREEERERLVLDEQLDALADAERQREEAARRMDTSISRLKRFCPSTS